MTDATHVHPESLPTSSSLRTLNGMHSGVSWAAIFAGALAASALSLLLFMLGMGLGLSSASPWPGQGIEARTAGWTAVAWVALTQLASAGLGGYLAGRLRVRWQGLHRAESYFRDTAHGFLAWSLATLTMAVLMGSVAGSAVLGAARATDRAAMWTALGTTDSGLGTPFRDTRDARARKTDTPTLAGADTQPLAYWVDSLLRQDGGTGDAAAPHPQRSTSEVARELTTLYTQAILSGQLDDEDARHVTRLVSEHTGLTRAQAEARVDQMRQRIAQTRSEFRQTAEQVRMASARSMLWFFLALLIGATVSSLLATWGGRQRDLY